MFTIFQKLGGVEATLDVIGKRRGLRPSLRAVKLWRSEGTLPAIAIVALMEECRERRIRFSLDDCRAREQRTRAREQRA